MRRLLVLALLCAALAARAETMAGRVIVVIDGDTVLFEPDPVRPHLPVFLKVRLVGIDAPEAGQPHGEAATRALRALALKQRGTLEIVGTDVYGRRLGWLSVGALQVNADLVRQGHAWASSRGADAPMRADQDAARRARRGLWIEAEPVPPWRWRREHPAVR